METKNDLGKKRALFSVAFVLLSVIVLLIIFLVNRDKIFTNLKETNFFERIFGSTPAVIENHQVKQDKGEELPLREDFVQNESREVSQDSSALPGLKSNVFSGEFGVPGTFGGEPDNGGTTGGVAAGGVSEGIYGGDVSTGVAEGTDGGYAQVGSERASELAGDAAGNVSSGTSSSTFVGEGVVSSENSLGNISGETSVSGNLNSSNGQINGNSLNGSTSVNGAGSVAANNSGVGAGISSLNVTNVITKDVAPKAAIATSSVDLCFVMIDGDGVVLRKMVKRAVPKSDSPLTTAINLLLDGPDVRNKAEAECRSLIPEGSKLLSARVSDGVAYLNFNEDFEFNPFGVEGAIHQLEQIVYTATAFSTVSSVQFLIEGEKREYLGSEGQWIGTPLSRANF